MAWTRTSIESWSLISLLLACAIIVQLVASLYGAEWLVVSPNPSIPNFPPVGSQKWGLEPSASPVSKGSPTWGGWGPWAPKPSSSQNDKNNQNNFPPFNPASFGFSLKIHLGLLSFHSNEYSETYYHLLETMQDDNNNNKWSPSGSFFEGIPSESKLRSLYAFGISMCILLNLSIFLIFVSLLLLILVHYMEIIKILSSRIYFGIIAIANTIILFTSLLLWTILGFKINSELESALGKNDTYDHFGWCYYVLLSSFVCWILACWTFSNSLTFNCDETSLSENNVKFKVLFSSNNRQNRNYGATE